MNTTSRSSEASWQDSVKHFARAAFSSFFKGDRTSTCIRQGNIRPHIKGSTLQLKSWNMLKHAETCWNVLIEISSSQINIRHIIKAWCGTPCRGVWDIRLPVHLMTWPWSSWNCLAAMRYAAQIVAELGADWPRSMIQTEESSAACGDRQTGSARVIFGTLWLWNSHDPTSAVVKLRGVILVANRRYLGGCLMIMNQLVMNQPEFMKPGLAFSQIDPAPSAGPWPSVAEMASCG